MEFEYDPIKSQSNMQKHGIDFEQAKALWEDEDRLVIPARSETEERYAILGKIKKKTWVGFYTHRSQAIRIFSVRRAHEKERQQYDS